MFLRRVTDVRELERRPYGVVLLGEGWLHFCAHEGLYGVVLFGRPGTEQMEALVRSLKLELAAGVPPHRSLVDASRIEGVDGGAFEVLQRYVGEHEQQLSRAVTQLALVRPRGLPGAVTSGFYAVAGSPYPVELFDDAATALAWLSEPPALAAALAALLEEITGQGPLVARLRAVLKTDLAGATLDAAARRLGISERTLQRRLKECGTTFAGELLAERLDEAERRMLDGDEPLASVALAAGFSSQQHFSTAWRQARGEQPSAFKRRHKAAPR